MASLIYVAYGMHVILMKWAERRLSCPSMLVKGLWPDMDTSVRQHTIAGIAGHRLALHLQRCTHAETRVFADGGRI